MEDRYLNLFRNLIIIATLITLVFLILMGIEENLSQEWKSYQDEYLDIIRSKTELSPDTPFDFRKEIQQITVDQLSIVDRCPSCHLGIENPFLKNVQQPFRTHPGKMLSLHSSEKFGCTTCHRGMGQVLEVQDVCQSTHSETIHSQRYIQSTCGKCHLAVFDENILLQGAEKLYAGLKIFKSEGCLGCHKLRKVGGIIGPDLTDQGKKIKGSYSFRHISGEPTIPNWLREHFIHPEKVSPGSAMLSFDLPEREMEELIIFTLGLYRPDYPLDYYSFRHLREFKERRQISTNSEVFSLFCAACHGKKGEGKDYQDYKTGVPTLMNQDFQAVASRDFIEFSILKGRSGRQMSTWNSEISGLYEDEIQKAIEYVRQWRISGPAYAEVKKLRGDLQIGRELYSRNCIFCHGKEGKDGITININNQDFLTTADNEFLYYTLVNGRANTAMPSWSRLSDLQLASLIALIRSWQIEPSLKLPNQQISGDVTKGRDLFDHLCIRCHGKQGTGGIGPAVLNIDFLKAASDYFLYQTIAQGRHHTAMFGWAKDLGKFEKIKTEDIRNIVAFMKTMEDSISDQIYPGQSVGRAIPGADLYEKYCTDCHGYEGEGKQAPALNNQEFLNAASNGFLLATISLGRQGTDMPSWGRGDEKHPALSGEQRNDIVAFLRTWQSQIIKKSDK